MACNGSSNYSTFTDKTDDGGSTLDIQICIIGELKQNAELLKSAQARMVTLIHHMGGSIRKDFIVSKTTHLVANSTTGEKYRYAANYGIPIMRADWIHELWAQRHNIKCRATDENMMKFKLQPFIGCKNAFIGFQDDEKKHMEEVSIQNGIQG